MTVKSKARIQKIMKYVCNGKTYIQKCMKSVLRNVVYNVHAKMISEIGFYTRYNFMYNVFFY